MPRRCLIVLCATFTIAAVACDTGDGREMRDPSASVSATLIPVASIPQ